MAQTNQIQYFQKLLTTGFLTRIFCTLKTVAGTVAIVCDGCAGCAGYCVSGTRLSLKSLSSASVVEAIGTFDT